MASPERGILMPSEQIALVLLLDGLTCTFYRFRQNTPSITVMK